MTMQASEKTLHDRINLPRLVKRIESTVKEDSWTVEGPARRDSWIKARGVLQVSWGYLNIVRPFTVLFQRILHARTLLKNLELDEPATTSCVHVTAYVCDDL